MTSTAFLSPAYTFTTSANGLVYLWGGRGNVEYDAIFIYHHSSEKWEKKLTRGQHPPAGLSNGGCTMSSHNLYLYGGCYGKNSHNGDLYQLNTLTWEWRKLTDGSAGGPGKKHGCRLISYQDQLLVVGGAYDNDDMMPASKQAGAEYLKGRMFVCTNEVHYYSLPTGPWISPSKSGFRPPPCYNFSLTRIDEKHAVMFGGSTSVSSSSDLYVLDMSEKTWSQHEERDPWPGARLGHIAACLDYGGHNPRLLISGGSAGNHIYHDMWLLDLQSYRMKEVQVQDKDNKKLQKSGHGAAAVTVNSDCEEVIVFGRKKRCDALVLRFVLHKGQWTLTAIVDNNRLGSPVQHAIKRKMSQSSSSQDGNNCKLLKQEQDADTGAAELQTQADDANRRDEDSRGRAGELPTQVQHSEYRLSLEKSLVETSAHGEEMIELVDLHSTLEETTTSQEETETQN